MKKMKRIFFYLFLALGLSSCSKNSTKVNIEIPEMNEGKISIVFANPDQVSNTSPSIIYSESFKDSKIEINLDSIKFEKDFIDCALLVTSNDESFFVNVPLPVERGKTIDVKFTNVEGYKKGEKIKLSYKGTKHAEDFTIFWDKIQDQLLEFSKLPVEKINEGYKNFVPTYKTYIDKHPQSGFPYMLLISQVNNMQFDKTNPLLDYCNTICSSPKDNRWKEVFCTLIGEKKLAQETSKKLVFQAVDLNGKYKSQGLTMIGISIDRTEREWRNYISSNPVAWLSLYGDGNVFTKRYDFQYIPYNLIADSEGNILAKNLHGAELDKFLEDYFSK